MKRTIAAALLLLASPTIAEVTPRPGPGDPHVQQVDYDPEQVVGLNAAPGFSITIELSPDERVENIALGNSGAWQVQVNRRGDRLFIKPLGTYVPTNMTVLTDARRYNFILRATGDERLTTPYVVHFTYPGLLPTSLAATPAPPTLYKLSGDRTLWPVAMSDDGKFTSIKWDADQAMPAVYRVDAHGAEALVNGSVQGGVFVIEGVARKFVFRLGKNEASARRKLAKAKR